MPKGKKHGNVAANMALVPMGGGQVAMVPASAFEQKARDALQKTKTIVKHVAYERRHQFIAWGAAGVLGLVDRWKPEALQKIAVGPGHASGTLAVVAEIPQHLGLSQEVKTYARDAQTALGAIQVFLIARGRGRSEQPGEIPGVAGGGQDAGKRPEASAPAATGASPQGAPVEVEIIEGVA